MTQQASTSFPRARTLRENIARIPSPGNIILSVPERQLPRLRTVLILFRIVLIIAGNAKLFLKGPAHTAAFEWTRVKRSETPCEMRRDSKPPLRGRHGTPVIAPGSTSPTPPPARS